MNPLITCIITCYENDPTEIIQAMLNQTYPNKQLLVFCSDVDMQSFTNQDSQCEFFDVPNRRDWGHSKRAMGIAFAEGKYVCFVNADDEYEPNFLEIMGGVLEKEKADFAYCDFKDKTIDFDRVAAKLVKGGMTSGNFVVKSDKAKKVGWQHRVYASDWYFIRDLLKERIDIVYVPYSLMTHN